MKSVTMAVFAAVGLVWAGMPDAYAGNRPATKQYTPVKTASSTATQATQASGQFERKCVIMSCGTPWCFNTRR